MLSYHSLEHLLFWLWTLQAGRTMQDLSEKTVTSIFQVDVRRTNSKIWWWVTLFLMEKKWLAYRKIISKCKFSILKNYFCNFKTILTPAQNSLQVWHKKTFFPWLHEDRAIFEYQSVAIGRPRITNPASPLENYDVWVFIKGFLVLKKPSNPIDCIFLGLWDLPLRHFPDFWIFWLLRKTWKIKVVDSK